MLNQILMSLKQTHFECLSSRLTIEWRTQSMRSIVVFWFMSATHCRVCFVCVYYTHVVELVSFMFIAFDRACLLFNNWLNQEINYWLVIVTDSLRMTSLMTRSIVICLWSKLTILVIQADSFYSASNIQQWTSFSSYLRDFRRVVYVQFSWDI